MATEYVLDVDKIAHWRIDNHVPLKQLARAAGVNLSSLSHAISNGREVKMNPVSYTHLRAHETDSYLVCRLLLEKKKRKDTVSYTHPD